MIHSLFQLEKLLQSRVKKYSSSHRLGPMIAVPNMVFIINISLIIAVQKRWRIHSTCMESGSILYNHPMMVEYVHREVHTTPS